MSALDDLKMIHERDKQDALGVAGTQWEQLLEQYEIPERSEAIDNIVYAGMGGSSLGALLSKAWPGYDRPFEVVRTYDIPAYVGPRTLFIAASFSGNTEETLNALAQAEQRGAIIVLIASGGRLAEIAEERSYPLAKLPKVSQPRYAALCVLKAIVQILVSYGLTDSGKITEVEAAAQKLQPILKGYSPDVPTVQNPAKQLALELMGSSPVIYASNLFYPVAYKWKISINENAKNVAWAGEYPEFNHNEFLGWSSHPVQRPYKVVDLRSSLDHLQIQKRFEISDRLLSGRRPAAEVVQLQGDSVLEQMLYGTTFGDFVSLYLALLNGLDPTPVDLIEKMKAELV